MSTHTCSIAWCVRPADIKAGDIALCARDWKRFMGWTR